MLSCPLSSYSVVDVLDVLGLRSGSLSPHDASLTRGPDGTLDAFALQRQLNLSTLGLEWLQIAENFSMQFGLYSVFNLSDYEGSVLTISDGSGFAFDVSLRMSDNSTGDELVVTLPGLSTLRIGIPASTSLRDGFQRLGIRLTHYQLQVVVNCEVVNFVNLDFDGENSSFPLPVFDDALVEVFGGAVTVSPK